MTSLLGKVAAIGRCGSYARMAYLKEVIVVNSSRPITSSVDARPQILNHNMSFRPAFDSPIDNAQRPIVIIYGWLGAKAKHIYKYADFYMGKGFDVLHVKVKPLQVLWPIRAQSVVEQILDFMQKSDHASKPILVHGFSVGGYLYGETLVKIVGDRAFDDVGKRIVGQIFDSPVDFEGVPRGTGMALSGIPVVQKSIKFSLELFMNTFKDQTLVHYRQSSAAFYENRLRIPSMMLHSESDPVGIIDPILAVDKSWRDAGVKVFRKCWKDSRHVSHFAKHPVEYIGMLNMFLTEVGLATKQQQDQENVIRQKIIQ